MRGLRLARTDEPGAEPGLGGARARLSGRGRRRPGRARTESAPHVSGTCARVRREACPAADRDHGGGQQTLRGRVRALRKATRGGRLDLQAGPGLLRGAAASFAAGQLVLWAAVYGAYLAVRGRTIGAWT